MKSQPFRACHEHAEADVFLGPWRVTPRYIAVISPENHVLLRVGSKKKTMAVDLLSYKQGILSLTSLDMRRRRQPTPPPPQACQEKKTHPPPAKKNVLQQCTLDFDTSTANGGQAEPLRLQTLLKDAIRLHPPKFPLHRHANTPPNGNSRNNKPLLYLFCLFEPSQLDHAAMCV